jgi:hypothetical protein
MDRINFFLKVKFINLFNGQNFLINFIFNTNWKFRILNYNENKYSINILFDKKILLRNLYIKIKTFFNILLWKNRLITINYRLKLIGKRNCFLNSN